MSMPVADASLIFDGAVLTVGDPPPGWAGYFEFRQAVTYEVNEVVKGDYRAALITVDHIVLEGAPNVRPDSPGLEPATFAPGTRLLVFARPTLDPYDGRVVGYEDFDPDAVLPYSSDTLEQIRRQL